MTIIKQNRTWNKIPVRIETNIETGAVYVYAIDAGFLRSDPLLFTSDGKGNDWNIQNPATLTREFNRRNNKNSSQDDVEKAFLTQGYTVFDNDRAAVINNINNYSDSQQGRIDQQRIFNQGTPRVKDPSLKTEVNSEGNQTTEPVTSTTEEPTSSVNQEGEPPTVLDDTSTEDGTVGSNGSVEKEPSQNGDQATENDPQGEQGQPVTSKERIDLSSTIYRYPVGNLDAAAEFGISYDYIKIKITDYVPSLGQDGSSFGGTDSTSRYYKEDQNYYETIILPMQPNISALNSVNWGDDSLNPLQALAGGALTSYFSGIGNGGNIMDRLKQLAMDGLQGAKDLIGEGVDNKQFIASFLAGQLVSAPNLQRRASGTVINPNMEMIFNGPRLRSFNFTFNMAPRFKQEAQQIRKIIKTLKKYSSPDRTAGRAFLKAPKIFLLQYIYNGNGELDLGIDHPYLNKIKPCALTNVDVNYTPDNTYMSYRDGGSMTAYRITLSFSEIEPIYQSDYDNTSHPMGY